MFGDIYRRKAAACGRMAKKATRADDRATYLKIKKQLLRIADELDCYSDKAKRETLRRGRDLRLM